MRYNTYATLVFVCTNVVFTGVAQAAISAAGYEIHPLGLTDAEHINITDGFWKSGVSFLNEAGQATGSSLRYDPEGWGLGFSAWLYSDGYNVNIGLIDTEHTRITDGYRYSVPLAMNSSGEVAGSARRYDSLGNSSGGGVWLHSAGNTAKIGLIDSEHTGATGTQSGTFKSLNELGQVIGESSRYGAWDAGSGQAPSLYDQSAWLYSNGVTVNIGLTDSEHTRDTYGNRYSSVRQLNNAGHVTGISRIYGGGGITLGQSAWLYSNGRTEKIGLIDMEHTHNADGAHASSIAFLNEAGQVAGYSTRYGAGGESLGHSAWLHSNGQTLGIGLTDTEHTRDTDGYRRVDIHQMNEAGQVLGSAHRYAAGGAFNGVSVWLDSNGITTNVGLADTEHTRDTDGHRYSFAGSMNEAGQVIGRSNRYAAGGASMGQNAWLYSNGNTVGIGLMDAEHTSQTDGTRYSYAVDLNEAGQVIGWTHRYAANGDSIGTSAWLYSNDSAVNLSLTDDDYTRVTDGYRASSVRFLNEAGQVAGSSLRFAGRYEMYESSGWTAWLYDFTNDELVNFVFSTTSYGYASSQIDYLGEDGLVLGKYRLFGDGDADLGDRAFAYTSESGALDLGSLVDPSLGDEGWDALIDAYLVNGMGMIAGRGLLTGMDREMGFTQYLLTPKVSEVPVPPAVWMLGSGLIGLFGIGRRNREKQW